MAQPSPETIAGLHGLHGLHLAVTVGRRALQDEMNRTRHDATDGVCWVRFMMGVWKAVFYKPSRLIRLAQRRASVGKKIRLNRARPRLDAVKSKERVESVSGDLVHAATAEAWQASSGPTRSTSVHLTLACVLLARARWNKQIAHTLDLIH